MARIIWLTICWIELSVLTLLLYLPSYLPKRIILPYYFPVFRLWCRFFVRALGVDLRLHQKNLKPLPRQYIMIANHPSALEDVGVPALFNVHSLAKEGVKNWWLAGRLNIAAGTIFVKRDSAESRHGALEEMITEVKSGKNILIYPEGGCKGKRIFGTFRYGAFDISLQTGVPIVPLFLHYEAQDDFEWKPDVHLLVKLWQLMTAKNNRANYYLYDAIEPDQFKDKKAYMEHVHKLYLNWQARYLD